MAKKSVGKVGLARRADRTSQRDVPTKSLKSSAMLDTRVIFDNVLRELESFFKRSHKVIVALMVKEILDEQIARKLA